MPEAAADEPIAVAAEIERRFGPAGDPDNPLGHAAVVAADERGEPLAAGERVLDEIGLNAEYVPRSLGGRLTGADRFTRTLRAVFRRDPVLGLGHGMASFIGSVPVWTAGNGAQRRWLADLLLRGDRVAAGYTELAHGGDFTRAELAARRDGGRYALSGGKQLISNVGRARAITVFARTDAARGSRSHTHLLVDRAAVPPDRFVVTPRFHTAGMRALGLAGVEFRDCPVPVGQVVGEVGGALEAVLRAFQVTRTVLPGMAVGILDTQLRLAVGFVRERVLYGRPAAELPRVRALLTDAYADLLVCDCVALVAARALHVLPGQTSVYAAAVKHLVPQLLHEADRTLSTVIGARSYLREGPYAVFQKNSRDLAVAMLAHASSATCQASLIPQLHQLATRSWGTAAPPPVELFRLGAPLPELDPAALALSARGRDQLSATLSLLDDGPGADATGPRLAALCAVFRDELADLAERCRALPPRHRTVLSAPGAFDLVDRYTTVLAANACIGVWLAGGPGVDLSHRDPAWLTAALRRLADRLGRPVPGGSDDDVTEALWGELCIRHEGGRAFDLAALPVGT